MANKKTSEWFASNPVTVAPGDLIPVTDDPGGTPTQGAFQIGQVMTNAYKIVPTLSGSDLVVTLTHLDGSTPSATNPLFFKVGNTLRSITAASSITLAAGTNWFNLGGNDTKTLTAPLFVYVVYDTNSSLLVPTIARKSNFRIVSETSATTTNQDHIYGYSGFTSTDEMVNIGYFEATLSGGAGYTWTVPTFTNQNLRNEPTYESRWMTWTPTITGYSILPTNTSYYYRVMRGLIDHKINETTNGTSNATTTTYTLPFTANTFTQASITAPVDNGAGVAHGVAQVAAGSNVMNCYKQAFAAWTNANAKRMNNITISLLL